MEAEAIQTWAFSRRFNKSSKVEVESQSKNSQDAVTQMFYICKATYF